MPLMVTGQTTPALSFAGLQTTVPVSGPGSPAGVARDSSGNLFVLDRNANQVIAVPANGGAQSIVATGLITPDAIAADAAGNLYIASTAPAQVVRIPAGGGAQTPLAISGLVSPAGLAVDGSGDVYVADLGGAQVIEFSAAGVQTTLGGAWSVPTGIAVDRGGNIYVADKSLTYIVKIPAGGGSTVSIGAGLVSPISVAVDLSGNVMVGVAGGQIFEITPSAVQTTIGTGSFQPLGLAPQAIGTVFVADAASNTVVEIQTVSVDFGNLNFCAAGQSSPAPCTRTLALNYAVNTATTLNAPSVSMQGTQNLDFTLAAGSTCSGAVTAGGTCAVNVTFTPQGAGSRMGAVQIQDTTGNLVTETFLHGIANGAQVAYGSPTVTTIASSDFTSGGLTADAAGNVYWCDSYGNFWRIPANGGAATGVIGGYYGAMAVDGAGNIYTGTGSVPYTGQGSITQHPWMGSAYGPGITLPNTQNARGVAVDGSGNIYTVINNNAVVEIPAGGGLAIQISAITDGSTVNAVALDSAGNVYVATTSAVMKVPAGGGPAKSFIAENFLSIAVDAAGDVYGKRASTGVIEYPAGGAPLVTIAPWSWFYGGVAVDGAGNVYYTNKQSDSEVVTAYRRAPVAPAFSFATTLTGHTSSDSPQSLLITNIGNQNLAVSNVGFATGMNFALVPGSGPTADCAASMSLAPTASCNLSFSFIPTVQGNLSDSLLISDNALNAAPAIQSILTSAVGLTANEPTQTSLHLSTTKILYGQPVTLTATVSAALGVPIGNVTFSSGTTAIGTAPLNANGVATFTTTLLPAGSDSVSASYAATSVFLASTSTASSISIEPIQFTGGSINVCPAGQNKPAPCSRNIVVTYYAAANATLGTPQVVTQGVRNLDFTLASTTCGGPITADSTCTVTVKFAPRLAGARPGAVLIVDASGGHIQTLYVSGIGLAPQTAFNSGAAVPIANSPQTGGIAIDPAGNIYWPDVFSSGQIMKWPAGGGASVPFSNLDAYHQLNCGYWVPLRLDNAGNVDFPNPCDGNLYSVSPDGSWQILYSGIGAPIAMDAQGNVYFSGWGPNWTQVLQELPAGGSMPVTLGTVNSIGGIAADGAGNVYVSDYDLNTWQPQIVKFPAGGGTPVVVTTNISWAFNLLNADAAGDVFYTDGQALYEIPAGSNTPVNIVGNVVQQGWDVPIDFTLDAAGNVYLVYQYSPILEVVRASAPSLSFASSIIKTASSDSPQSVQIQNVGDTPLAISKLQVAANFTKVAGPGTPADCAASSSLTPGALCNLSISFIPTTTGALQGSATFTDNALNATGATQSIALSGIGTAKNTSSLKLTSSLNPSIYGQAVTFTATVTSSSGGIPTGTVNFKHGGLLGTATLTNGVAMFTTSALKAGSAEAITAVYSGNATNAGSTATVSQTVQQSATTVTLTSSVNPSAAGVAVTFAATVTAGSGPTPTGTVRFNNGTVSLGRATLNNGIATFTTSKLPAGASKITAVYGGNSSDAGSTSAALIQTVQ